MSNWWNFDKEVAR